MGRERPLLAAMELGRKVKSDASVSGSGRCCGVQWAWRRTATWPRWRATWRSRTDWWRSPWIILPDALAQLSLRDLPGIGARTEKRLNERGIQTMEDLLALDCEQAGQLWGSVWGERLWHWLRGEDFEMSEVDHLKSISHQHVLAPDMRTQEKAWAVAHKLLHKAAMRLRSGGLWAGSIGLAVGFAVPRSENTPVSRFGVPSRGWHGEIKLTECQDNQTLIAALRRVVGLAAQRGGI